MDGFIFGSRRGASSFIPLAMLAAGISAFMLIANASIERRRKQLQEVEKKFHIRQLEAKLKGALRDPSFFHEKLRAEIIKNHPVVWIDQIGEDEVWLGAGSGHHFPSLKPCKENCPLRSRVEVQRIVGADLLPYLKIIASFTSKRPNETGFYNREKRENRVEVAVPAQQNGLVLDKKKLYCAPGYAIHYITAPPLEVLCRRAL